MSSGWGGVGGGSMRSKLASTGSLLRLGPGIIPLLSLGPECGPLVSLLHKRGDRIWEWPSLDTKIVGLLA